MREETFYCGVIQFKDWCYFIVISIAVFTTNMHRLCLKLFFIRRVKNAFRNDTKRESLREFGYWRFQLSLETFESNSYSGKISKIKPRLKVERVLASVNDLQPTSELEKYL